MSHKYGRPEDVMDVDETDDVAAAADDEADAMDAMDAMEEDAENRHLRAVSLVDVDTRGGSVRQSARVDRGALMEVMSAVGGGRTNASISAVPWRVKLMQIEEEIFII